MPYFISDTAEGCDGWATVKDDGEVMGCHMSKQDAIDQALAIAQAEDSTFEGERAALPGVDKFTTEAEAIARADELGCEGAHSMDEDGQVIYMPCSTHAAYAEVTGGSEYERNQDDLPSEPAPPEDQIEGSDVNEPGSAAGPGGDVEFSEATETALRNKVTEHNEAMEEDGKPDYTRTTYGQLATVYRRGSGAYSTSHRPGISRAAWSMARVNAYLYLLRNGRPENAAYVGDNDLLPEGHPRSTRSLEARQVDLEPPAYMRASARRGLEWHRRGLSGDGVVDRTIREARAMAEGNVTADKWVRLRAWIARHLVDMDAPANTPGNDDYPGPGAVAMALWGGGGSKRSAERALAYADGVVGRLEEENEGRAKGEALSKLETRIFEVDEFEVREDTNGMHLEGYAALFNSRSENLGGFTETIQPGAFRSSLKARNDIKLLWNHDTSAVMGSTRAGTLVLTEDERGLRVSATLPNTTHGRDAAELVRRGDVTGFSFGFSMPARGGDEWNSEGSERVLKSVRLHEVSLTPFPAYTSTNGTATMRGLDKIAHRANVDADALADALLKIENGEDISSDDRTLLQTVIDELAPEPEAPVKDNSLEMLALKKKKLQLLMES